MACFNPFVMIEQDFIAFGLTPREAKIYLMLLRLGEAPASAVARRCDLPRLSVYSVLERLVQVNLVTSYENRRTKVYHAAPPEAFLKTYDQEISSLQAKKVHFTKNFLPQLKSYLTKEFRSADMGHLSFIQDRVLFQSRCVDALKNSRDWYVVHDGSLWPLIASIRGQATVQPRCLLPFSEQRRLVKYGKGIEVHYVPNAFLQGPLCFMLMGSVAMFILEDGLEFSAVEIEHDGASGQLRTLLSLLWRVPFFED